MQGISWRRQSKMVHTATTDSAVSESFVRLIRSAGQSADGRVSEVTDTAVLVDFRPESCPEGALGEWIKGVVSSERNGASVEFKGRLVARIEELGRTRLRFELGSDDLSVVSMLVDRRGQQRIEPTSELKARLCSPAGESLAVGKIVNLSRTGISIELDASQASAVDDHGGVFLTCLLLPGDEGNLQMAAVVRNEELRDDQSLLLGLEFGTTGAATFMREIDRIERYVSKVQSETLDQLEQA